MKEVGTKPNSLKKTSSLPANDWKTYTIKLIDIKILIASGIKSIFYNENYNNDPLVEKLAQLSKITIKQIG